MSVINNIGEDINAANRFSLTNKIIIVLFNRGFHALLWYRISNQLYRWRIPILPLVFTRLIQIIYAIDVDFKATLSGGIVIVHGVGLVIGSGAYIDKNVILFHGVTLGRRGIGAVISSTDGFPVIGADCIICAGAKIIGKVNIGAGSVVGANCVVSKNIPAGSVCKLREENNLIYQRS